MLKANIFDFQMTVITTAKIHTGGYKMAAQKSVGDVIMTMSTVEKPQVIFLAFLSTMV